jgi:hypothetical protein
MTSISRHINTNTAGPIGPTGINVFGNDFENTSFRINSGISGGTGAHKNKWTRDQEELLAKWADKALCYRWLHDLSERKFNDLNNRVQIPVIILSTLTGAINVGINSIFPPNLVVYGSFGLGAISISTGIITTIGNFLRYAQKMEGHRVASLQWAKFHRNISAELAIHPDQRVDSIEFFTIKRAELDRLVDSAPQIPSDIIEKFENKFRDVDIDKPEICDYLEPTYIYEPGKKKPKCERKKKTFSEKFFSAFSSSKNKDDTNGGSASGNGEHVTFSTNRVNNSNDIHTDEESIVTFNNDSNKGSPNHKKLNYPTTFAEAASAAGVGLLSVTPGVTPGANAGESNNKNNTKHDEDVEKGIKKILNSGKKEEKEKEKDKEQKKEDSELSNKLHMSILESLNR